MAEAIKSRLFLRRCSTNKGVRRAAEEAIGPGPASKIQKAFRISKGGWLVVPVVGQRDSIVRALDDALSRALKRHFQGRIPNSFSKESGSTADRFLKRLTAAAEECAHDNDGILIVVDEMGRFLEHAATTDGDISFLQELAEIVGRLEQKVVIVGVLHQAFEQYASRLGTDGRDEWAKIQGRFVEPLATGPEYSRLISRPWLVTRHRRIMAPCAQIASFIRAPRWPSQRLFRPLASLLATASHRCPAYRLCCPQTLWAE